MQGVSGSEEVGRRQVHHGGANKMWQVRENNNMEVSDGDYLSPSPPLCFSPLYAILITQQLAAVAIILSEEVEAQY